MEELCTSRMVSWLQQKGNLHSIYKKLLSSIEAISIEFCGMEVMEWDVEVGEILLNDPDLVAARVLQRLWSMMPSFDDVKSSEAPERDPPWQGSRLWFRLANVPLPAISADQLPNEGIGVHQERELVYVYGVAHATFMRRFRCQSCGLVQDFYHEQKPTLSTCCDIGPFDEEVAAAIHVPYQEVLLGSVPNIHDRTISNRGHVSVSLRDDLAGRVQVGHALAIIGHAFRAVSSGYLSIYLPTDGHLFCQTIIEANNIIIPFNLRYLRVCGVNNFVTKLPWISEDGSISLDEMCDSLFGRKGNPYIGLCPQHLTVSLLLSLVSSGSFSSHDANADGSGYALFQEKYDRKHVHVLVTSASPCSGLLGSLQAAALYAERSVCHPQKGKTLIASLGQCDTATASRKLFAGNLPLSHGGVCLIDLSKNMLVKEDMKSLSDAMDKRSVVPRQSPEFVVPCASTIWAFHASHSSKDNGLANSECGNGFKSQSLTHQLLSKFDIIIPLRTHISPDTEDIRIAEIIMDLNRNSTRNELFNELQEYLCNASSIGKVIISKGADDMLRSYYLLLRKDKRVDPDDVSLLTLESLVRVACACSRLCWRNEALQVPDATLAIFLFEVTHLAKYGCSTLQELTERIVKELFLGQSKLQGPLDECLHDFHRDILQYLHSPLAIEE
ncbi:hypothetical protein O6H91_23G065600 [Diphasiastrum complanatum]|uniref:Uncharacterized protein n=1 Tax=Diphasiastrum complanatum TaxID=34168 RepID=A0ACC2ABN9_DIPCM|nr:hypothetical protein O6H91_23G065600 [Diphasiastrum complanatum]